jgi:hypothetical protein
MTGDWTTVIGTLGGAVVGAFAGLAGQRAQWKQQRATRWDPSRHEVYASFVAAAERYHTALWRVAYARRHGHSLVAPWNEANARYGDASSLVEQVALLATSATERAARALSQRLEDFRNEIYSKTHLSDEEYNKSPLKTEPDYLEVYRPIRDQFVDAAKQELGLLPTEQR